VDNSSCIVNLPDMPKTDNSFRTFHNLIYLPVDRKLLACNGLTDVDMATCDALNMTASDRAWAHHSYPNKGSTLDALWNMNSKYMSDYSNTKKRNPNQARGRYAAEALTVDNSAIILGGMIYEKDSHWATKETRLREGSDWTGRSNCQMNMKRAFFCSVKIQDEGVINIGGFTDEAITDNVGVSRNCGGKSYKNLAVPRKLASLPTPLSGHGCTVLPDSYDILVSGGSRNQNDRSKVGSYVYRWSKHAWEPSGEMNSPRFGHRIVAVGPKVYTIGGKERHPDLHLDTIEEYNVASGEWTLAPQKLKRTRAHFGIALVPRSLFPGCA